MVAMAISTTDVQNKAPDTDDAGLHEKAPMATPAAAPTGNN